MNKKMCILVLAIVALPVLSSRTLWAANPNFACSDNNGDLPTLVPPAAATVTGNGQAGTPEDAFKDAMEDALKQIKTAFQAAKNPGCPANCNLNAPPFITCEAEAIKKVVIKSLKKSGATWKCTVEATWQTAVWCHAKGMTNAQKANVAKNKLAGWTLFNPKVKAAVAAAPAVTGVVAAMACGENKLVGTAEATEEGNNALDAMTKAYVKARDAALNTMKKQVAAGCPVPRCPIPDRGNKTYEDGISVTSDSLYMMQEKAGSEEFKWVCQLKLSWLTVVQCTVASPTASPSPTPGATMTATPTPSVRTGGSDH